MPITTWQHAFAVSEALSQQFPIVELLITLFSLEWQTSRASTAQRERLSPLPDTMLLRMLVAHVHSLHANPAIPEAPRPVETPGKYTWSSHAHALLEAVGPRSVLWMRSTTAANIALCCTCCLGRDKL